MSKYGIIGNPLTHSFSPDYFKHKFDHLGLKNFSYDRFPLVDIHQVKDLLPHLYGANVTIPYKQSIIPFLDDLSTEARKIGAVNCIKNIDGKLKGYNTDYYGFRQSLENFVSDVQGLNALVLGSGGASKAVQQVLLDMNIQFKVVSRNPPNLQYHNLTNEVAHHALIINTTPLGMYPETDKSPDINYNQITDKHFLYDLIYNPEKSLFLSHGERYGAKIMNGHDMLILQAEKSWDIWTNNLMN